MKVCYWLMEAVTFVLVCSILTQVFGYLQLAELFTEK